MGDVGFFDAFAPVYDYFMPGVDREALLSGVEMTERDVEWVVDLGGGTGRGVRVVEARGKVILDASSGMVRRAGVEGVLGDAARVPFFDCSVDVVIVVDALHHIRCLEGVVEESWRVLREGGVLVVCDFDPGSLRGRLLWFVERVVGMGSVFYSPDEVSGVMIERGFRVSVPRRGFGYTVVGLKP